MKMVNHECYVDLEVAKLLERAGFNWKEYLKPLSIYDGGGSVWKIPLHIAQKWLREVHHLHITIFSSSQESWMFRITKQHQKLEDGVYGEDFYTYEEAQEAGIQKCLTILSEEPK